MCDVERHRMTRMKQTFSRSSVEYENMTHFLPLLIIDKFSHSFAATEIRCQEKSRGGLRYEVIMAEPNLVKSQAPVGEKKKAPVVKPQLSVNDIEEKLKAAEQRRLV